MYLKKTNITNITKIVKKGKSMISLIKKNCFTKKVSLDKNIKKQLFISWQPPHLIFFKFCKFSLKFINPIFLRIDSMITRHTKDTFLVFPHLFILHSSTTWMLFIYFSLSDNERGFLCLQEHLLYLPLRYIGVMLFSNYPFAHIRLIIPR